MIGVVQTIWDRPFKAFIFLHEIRLTTIRIAYLQKSDNTHQPYVLC